MKNCQYDKMTQKLQIVKKTEIYSWIGRDEIKHCV